MKAIIKHNGTVSGIVPLAYAGEPSMFKGTLDITKRGNYEVIIYSYDSSTGNTGVDKTTFSIN